MSWERLPDGSLKLSGSVPDELLESVFADFPRRRDAAISEMQRWGIRDPQFEYHKAPPKSERKIPTLDKTKSFAPTPMLIDRFKYADEIDFAGEIWLGAEAMGGLVLNNEFLESHLSKRNHWEGSAPNLYPDHHLSLFSVTDGVPEDAIYLVWKDGVVEPELWMYSGIEEEQFSDLT